MKNVKKYLDLFNTNVPIIVDDTHRKVEKDIAENLVKTLNRDFIEVKEHNKSAYVII
jgi:hypothetical protein